MADKMIRCDFKWRSAKDVLEQNEEILKFKYKLYGLLDDWSKNISGSAILQTEIDVPEMVIPAIHKISNELAEKGYQVVIKEYHLQPRFTYLNTNLDEEFSRDSKLNECTKRTATLLIRVPYK